MGNDTYVDSCSCKAAFGTKSEKCRDKMAFDWWCSRSAFKRRPSFHSNIHSRLPRWICSDMGCFMSCFVTCLQHKTRGQPYHTIHILTSGLSLSSERCSNILIKTYILKT